MNTYFISDLHLSETRPDLTNAFTDFIGCLEAIDTDALYILGDLFEFWVGDDDDNAFNLHIKQQLKACVDKGIPTYFVKGNRDFLVGKRFAKQTGVTLLGDETVVELYGVPTLLLHGDTLCTDDLQYQAFRRKVNLGWLQWLFNHLPLSFRLKVVSKVKGEANDQKGTKEMTIMDVNADAVIDAFKRHQVQAMIHGHTHKPKLHHYDLDGRDASRQVLGDWGPNSYILRISATDSEILSQQI